ncbi:hypothetical protein FPV67DRAFT_1088611 [Lyophyllum atratum]|nr:hypothetical protein FPV67DRAFT_1088611 [Lyophyllum atratum]
MSTVAGTQSPPLEATGEDRPMGASSVHRVGEKVEWVKDSDQRKQYFQPESESKAESDKQAPRRQQNLGESMADKFDKQT